MATGKQVGVGTTETSLHADSGSTSGALLKLANRGAASVFLGGSGVATTSGYELASGEKLDVRLGAGEELFGIVASGEESVHVLVTGD